MIRTVASVVALAAVVAKAQGIDIAALTQCANAVINFSAATPPYYVAVLPAENTCEADAITEFQNVYETSVNFYANLNAGTQVIIYVEDANGAEFWSNTITVGGGDSSCLGGGDNYVPQSEEYIPPVEEYVPPANNEVEVEEEEETVEDVPIVPETPTSSAPDAAYTPPRPSSEEEPEEDAEVDVPNNVANAPTNNDESEVVEQPVNDGDTDSDSSAGITSVNLAAAIGLLIASYGFF